MVELSDIQSYLTELRTDYLKELPEKIAAIEGAILEQERKVGPVDLKLLRDVHSIKGAAGSFGFAIASTICHQFEDELQVYVKRDADERAQSTSRLLSYVDFLKEAVAIAVDPGLAEDARELRWQQILPKLRALTGNERAKILIVDHSRVALTVIERGMTKAKVAVSYCSDGYEELGRLLREDFDLVIAGRNTHGLNGPSLIAATRMNRSKAPPFILLASDQFSPQGSYDAPTAIVMRDKDLVNTLPSIAQSIISEHH